ncbi:Ger(x)C family spore germination protein [Paenibacillus sp. y28]|uniref:Ger(x)C family spore germination protein n=1 Tax=Paenibacillus sp. y28 TaxID=3129110 RepID=UPI00301725BC
MEPGIIPIRIKQAVLVLLIGLLLTGCWDRREINDVAFVLGTAIDKEEDGYRVSILIPLPGNMGGTSGGGGGSGGKNPYTVKSEVAKTPREAIMKLQLGLSRNLFFAHRRVMLLSEEVVKEGIEPLMDSVTRIPENRLTTLMAVTKGKAHDFLSADIKLERFATEQIRELLISESTLKASVKDVVSEINQVGKDILFPYLEIIKLKTEKDKSEEIRATGFAITKNGVQVGLLQNEQALSVRLLRSPFKSYTETCATEQGVFSIDISHATSQIKPVMEGDRIRFEVKVHAEGNIYEDISNGNTFDSITEVEDALAQKMTANLEQTLDLLKSKKSDVIGLGQTLAITYPQQWMGGWKQRWDELYSNCAIQVAVDVNVYRVGMTRENLTAGEKGV